MTKRTAPILLKKTPKGKKHSFYEIYTNNDRVNIRFGSSSPFKGGGRRIEKQCDSHAKARKQELKNIRKKLDDGYHYVIHGKKHKFPLERAERQIKKLLEKERQKIKEREKQRRHSAPSSYRSYSASTSTTTTSSTTPSTLSSPSISTSTSTSLSNHHNNKGLEYINNKTAPKRWVFQGDGSTSFGLCVTDKYCFVGDRSGNLYSLDRKSGALRNSIDLGSEVLAIIYDNGWLYAGTDDGSIYDCTSEVPRLAYKTADAGGVLWIDIEDGILSVSYAHGTLVQLNIEGEILWKGNTKSNASESWIARSTTSNVYHAAENILRSYRFTDGNMEWEKLLPNFTFFATQSDDNLYIASKEKVYKVKKEDGSTVQECQLSSERLFSCCHSEDEKLVFASSEQSGYLFCYDLENDEKKWEFPTGIGAFNTMQYYDGYLYGVTNSGKATCVDISDAAVANNVEVNKTMARTKATNTSKGTSNAFNRYLTLDNVEQTDDPSEGVNLICVRDEKKNSLRIRVTSDGYHKNWNVQFPLNIRVEGYRYVCEEVEVGRTGNFYRSKGFVKLLVDKVPDKPSSTTSSRDKDKDTNNNDKNNTHTTDDNDDDNDDDDGDTSMTDNNDNKPSNNDNDTKSQENKDDSENIDKENQEKPKEENNNKDDDVEMKTDEENADNQPSDMDTK